MSANWELTAGEFQELFDEWIEDYDIDAQKSIEAETMTMEEYEMLVELDKKNLVWTEHGTCEDTMVSPGLTLVGDIAVLGQKSSGCGCWQAYTFYIAGEPYGGDKDSSTDWVFASAYLPCSICNPAGENEDEDSYNPECEECEGEGFANHYFD
jgi:hypothetical protein